SFNRAEAMQICSKGIVQSFCEFMAPSAGAMNCISEVERKKALLALPQDTYRDYLDLLRFNIEIGAKGLINSLTAVTDYYLARSGDALQANLVTLFGGDGEDVVAYTARQRRLFDLLVNVYPKAIRDI